MKMRSDWTGWMDGWMDWNRLDDGGGVKSIKDVHGGGGGREHRRCRDEWQTFISPIRALPLPSRTPTIGDHSGGAGHGVFL